MATERPRVRVYQESVITNVVGQPALMIPCIIGPSYQIRDHANTDDHDGLNVGDYGDTDAVSDGLDNGRPLSGATVLTLSAPPDLEDGALLDAASCELVLEDVVVELATGTDGVFSTSAPTENSFSSASATFLTDGIAAGDILVLANSSGDAYETRMTIRSVSTETGLLTFANYDATPLGTATSLRYRIERALTGSFNVGADFLQIDDNEVTILGGVVVDYDAAQDGTVETRPVSTATMFIQYRALRTTLGTLQLISQRSDITSVCGRLDYRNPLCAAAEIAWRESSGRQFYVVGVETDDEAGYTDALSAIDDRLDIYAIVPLTTDRGIIDLVVDDVEAKAAPDVSNFRLCIAPAGEIIEDAVVSAASTSGSREVPSGSSFTLLATATTTSFVSSGIASGDSIVLVADGATDVSRVVDRVLSSNHMSVTTSLGSNTTVTKRWYALRPTPPVLANLRGVTAYSLSSVNYISPDTAPATPNIYPGQVIRLTVGSTVTDHLVLAWSDTTAAASVDFLGGDEIVVTAVDEGILGNNIRFQFTDTNGFVGVCAVTEVSTVSGVTTIYVTYDASTTTRTQLKTTIEGDTDAGALVTVTVASGGTALPDTLATSTTHFGSGNAGKWSLTGGRSAGFSVISATAFPDAAATATVAPVSDGTATILQAITSRYSATESVHYRKPFSRLLDASAAFSTSTPPVLPGDFVEIPAVSGDFTSTITRLPILTVDSDNRLTLRTGYEFPVASASNSQTTASVASYRIARDFSTTQKAAALVDNLTARASDRYVATWPDVITSSFVTNSATGAIPQVGGWLLSAAIAGRLSSVPPHQSLTQAAFSTVSSVVHGTDLFSRTNIDTLAQGGLLVVIKPSLTAAPYCVVQSLSDVDFLPRAEVSTRVLYDYVSRQFKAVLEAFQGTYNITTESAALLDVNVQVKLDALKRDRKARLGSPLLSTSTARTVVDVEVGTVEVIVEAVFPKPWGSSTLRIRGR